MILLSIADTKNGDTAVLNSLQITEVDKPVKTKQENVGV